MSDPFKSIATLVEAKQTAQLADFAAKEMARHCDARIEVARKEFAEIETLADEALTVHGINWTLALQAIRDKARSAKRMPSRSLESGTNHPASPTGQAREGD